MKGGGGGAGTPGDAGGPPRRRRTLSFVFWWSFLKLLFFFHLVGSHFLFFRSGFSYVVLFIFMTCHNFWTWVRKWILDSAKRLQICLDVQTSENWKIDFSSSFLRSAYILACTARFDNFGSCIRKLILNSAKRLQICLDFQTSENWKFDFSTFFPEVRSFSHLPLGIKITINISQIHIGSIKWNVYK